MNNKSRIRRISKDEQDARRRWPEKKHLASENEVPLPQPGDKNRIHSVLVALPVIMLVVGLFVHFRGESAQNNGVPLLDSLVSRQAQFKSVSEVSGIGKPKYYLWYNIDGSDKGARISEAQKNALSQLASGDNLLLELAPTVEGSSTLWVYRVRHDGVDVVAPSAN